MNKLLFLPLIFIATLFCEQFTLSNGLKVVLIENSSEDDVLFAMVKKGGFSVLPADEQPAGRVASEVVWEGGFNGLTSDQISNTLYDFDADLVPDILPFARKIEGSTSVEGLEEIVGLIRDIFTKPNLSNLRKGKANLLKTYDPIKNEVSENFDNFVKLTNTNHFAPFIPLTRRQVEEANLDVIKSIFQESFSDLNGFVLVMVGPFKSTDLRSLIETHLGSISGKNTTLFDQKPNFPSFPSGITIKSTKSNSRIEQLTRLSFPLNIEFTEANLYKLEYICEVIEAHLRDKVKTDKFPSIDVGYELPFYPYTDAVWLSIQAPLNDNLSKEFTDILVGELAKLQKEGPSESSLRKAFEQIEYSKDFWEGNSEYLIGRTINASLWGWDPKPVKPRPLAASVVKKDLNDWIDLNHYSKISTK